MMRRQLPAYSPLESKAIARAAAEAALRARQSRLALAEVLATRFQSREVVLTASGTQALQVALEVAGATAKAAAGGAVALPGYSCYDVVSAAVGASAGVVFYDVDPSTLAPDLPSVRAALRLGVRIVVAGNLYGFPLDWDALRAECATHGAVLVEDAAQGIGSRWRGREGGSFGDLTVLSFGRGKGWTGGGGGALLVRVALSEEASLRLRRVADRSAGAGASLRAGTLATVQWALGRPALYGLVAAVPGTGLGETRYKPPSEPRRIPAFCAAAALELEPLARAAVEVRRSMALEWDRLLETLGRRGVERCTTLAGGETSYLRYPLLLDRADAVCRFLSRAGRGGAARGYPRPLYELPAARPLEQARVAALPGAERLARCLVTLPTHGGVTFLDRALVEAALTAEVGPARP
jgi:dTDP-4-amino-4,6-dideoxygalactose transaminase